MISPRGGVFLWYCQTPCCFTLLLITFSFVSPETWARQEALKRLAAKEVGEAEGE